MADIAGIPFTEANFDKDGNLQNALAIVGVFWPSKKFDDLAFEVGQGNAAAVGVSDGGEAVLAAKLEELKAFFTAPAEIQKLEAAKAALRGIQTSPAERKKFASNIRALLNPAAANREDASDTFLQSSEEELMESLRIPIAATVPPETRGGGAAFEVGSGPALDEGGGAGIGSFLDSFKTAALNILNYTTYYEMKTRAGTVGNNGGAGPLIDKLAAKVDRIHLIGHSFGGRLVTAAAKESKTNKLASLTLLQAAFSHNGFSRIMKGFFRNVVEAKRVAGPILITNSKNDKAVGLAYPIASRINNDTTMAIAGENDKFGGIGRN
jgi:hypothetical protein